MPVPEEYQRIYDRLYGFLKDVRDICDIETTHRAYTTAQGVFRVFRQRIEVSQAIAFSNILTAGIRSLFVAAWDPSLEKLPFTDRKTMTEEVRSLRKEHNFAPESAIRDVAEALRRNVDNKLLDEVLKKISPEAVEFWDPNHSGD